MNQITPNRIYDNHGRIINYLRLAVTDRCNLRCFYCMPEEGINYVDKKELLTYEEMIRLIKILANLGIEKIRITGGEPFVRKGMMGFLEAVCGVPGIKQVHLTTNGTMTAPLLPALQKMGIRSINLSLDSLNQQRFFDITRRDVFPEVMKTFHALIESDIQTKINAVVMAGQNTDDIIPMVNLAKEYPVAVRFIEEMPFNGSGDNHQLGYWNHKKILEHIKSVYPDLQKLPDPPFSTSANYQIPGHRGSFGIIAAYSRTFCGTCNRIRLTPSGLLKTCLYDDGVFNVRDFMRAGASNQEVTTLFLEALSHRAKDGFEAENRRQNQNPINESMSTIGG